MPAPKAIALTALVPAEYDYISLAYDGNGDLETVVYQNDGSTVATLTLAYTAGVLQNITRS
tara:strand:+ start:351 stop:533 length:183 start_codon:yes stop_codon:yes gene_type:complete